jgi:hypothetical protein
MINKFNKYLIAAFGAIMITFSACSSDFLETTTSEGISSVAAVKTSDNLMNIINGIHRDMYVRSPYGQGYNGQTGNIVMFESMADDLVHTATGLNWHIAAVRWLEQDVETSAATNYPWRFYYKIINNANVVIEGGPAATGDATIKDKAIGEAYAYRAWAMFQLVQIYGKRYTIGGTNSDADGGVILRLTIGEEPMPRSTVAQSYQQIESDLNASIALLTGKTRVHKSHFSAEVVKGIKARVLLLEGRYLEAATLANQARTGFALMSNATYKAGFNKLTSNDEWMWGSEVIADQSDGFGNFGAYMSRNYNSSTIRTAPKAIYKPLFDKFPASDVRTQNFDVTGLHTSLGLPSTFVKKPYTSQKFMAESTTVSLADVPYMRAGEMYLLEAEALARAGGANEATSKTLFTTFMKNRNPSYTAPVGTGAAYITEIMDSRRIELWGEGFRWFDLKRLNQNLKRDDVGSNHVSTVVNSVFNIANTDPRWNLKIPRQELDANSLCKQNP